MTHSGGKPHAVGDKGQRYEVRYRDGDDTEHVMGWTDKADGGGLALSIMNHPVWKLSRIIDRRAPQPKMIPNPLYCEKCEGRGYLVADAEWEPYAVECDGPVHKKQAANASGRSK